MSLPVRRKALGYITGTPRPARRHRTTPQPPPRFFRDTRGSVGDMTETKPTHGRAARPKPRALYPAWPDDTTAEGAHALVQAFVRNLATFADEQAGHGVSQSELARRADVAKATLSKVLRGDVWPDSVTVARFEHLAGRRLWDGAISVTSPEQSSPASPGDTDTD